MTICLYPSHCNCSYKHLKIKCVLFCVSCYQHMLVKYKMEEIKKKISSKMSGIRKRIHEKCYCLFLFKILLQKWKSIFLLYTLSLKCQSIITETRFYCSDSFLLRLNMFVFVIKHKVLINKLKLDKNLQNLKSNINSFLFFSFF